MRRLVFALVVACSGSTPSQMLPTDGPNGPNDGPVVPGDGMSRAEACMMYATARCTQLQTCSAARLTRNFGDLGTCVTREALECTKQLGATDTGDTEATRIACGSALAAETCAVFLGNSLPDACFAPGPNAGTCAFTDQCSTSYCAIGANSLCGVCQDTPVVGQSCAASSCGNTLVCDSTNNLCETAVGSGKACNPATPCDHALSCVGATTTQNGTCQPDVATLGGACDSTRKTRALCSADAGLTCSTTTNQCVAQPLGSAGAACGIINGTDSECEGGGTCGTATSKCLAPAADGGACDTKNGPNCLFPARCIPSAQGLTTGSCQILGTSPSC